MAGKTPAVNPRLIPSCVYTDPETPAVGLTADVRGEKQGPCGEDRKYVMTGNAKA
jgi:pyruvate/2-oxoglutarate dehydrogenase complex dihydrolipoamide dehydrogenase (E3) component